MKEFPATSRLVSIQKALFSLSGNNKDFKSCVPGIRGKDQICESYYVPWVNVHGSPSPLCSAFWVLKANSPCRLSMEQAVPNALSSYRVSQWPVWKWDTNETRRKWHQGIKWKVIKWGPSHNPKYATLVYEKWQTHLTLFPPESDYKIWERFSKLLKQIMILNERNLSYT